MLDISDTKADDLTIRVNVAKDIFSAYDEATIEYFEDFFDRQSKIINDTHVTDKHFIIGYFSNSSIVQTDRTDHKYLKQSKFQGEIQDTIIQNMYKLFDIFFTNASETSVSVVEYLNTISLPVDSHHTPLEITIQIDSLSYIKEVPIEKFNSYRADYDYEH